MTPALGSTVIVKQTQPATQLYTLSLHDALPICQLALDLRQRLGTILVRDQLRPKLNRYIRSRDRLRSEEHTPELQSLRHLVCRLLLEENRHLSIRVATDDNTPLPSSCGA